MFLTPYLFALLHSTIKWPAGCIIIIIFQMQTRRHQEVRDCNLQRRGDFRGVGLGIARDRDCGFFFFPHTSQRGSHMAI